MIKRLTAFFLILLIAVPMCCCGLLGKNHAGADSTPACCHKKQQDNKAPGSDNCPCKSKDKRSFENTDAKQIFVKFAPVDPFSNELNWGDLPLIASETFHFRPDPGEPRPAGNQLWREHCVYLL